jgi:hypothetical protein
MRLSPADYDGEILPKHDVAVGTLDFWRKRRRQERGEVADQRLRARGVDVRAEARGGETVDNIDVDGAVVATVLVAKIAKNLSWV